MQLHTEEDFHLIYDLFPKLKLGIKASGDFKT